MDEHEQCATRPSDAAVRCITQTDNITTKRKEHRRMKTANILIGIYWLILGIAVVASGDPLPLALQMLACFGAAVGCFGCALRMWDNQE